jgi:hypothetical protein
MQLWSVRLIGTFAVVSAIGLAASARASVLCVNPGGTSGCYARISDAVSASVDGDTINVAAGTYNEGNIFVTDSISIVGAGIGSTTVDGGSGPAPVFRFPGDFPAITASLSQLTIQHGYRGVDAGRFGTITLDHVRVTGNGPGSGAGVFTNASVVNIESSTIDHNHAADGFFGCDWSGGSGGGIASLCGGGSYNIRNTTIRDNVADSWGGGIIVNDSATLIENSTISGNTALWSNDQVLGGGALFVGGAFPQITIRFSTLAGNSAPSGAAGAILGGGSGCCDSFLSVESSVLSNNTAANAAEGTCQSLPGQLNSLGYNVVSDASCPDMIFPGDLTSTPVNLGPLQDNGGPTSTHALLIGSPAINHAPLCGVATDQRGIARPQLGTCDSGAFELTGGDLIAQLQTLAASLQGVGPGGSLSSKVTRIVESLQKGNTSAACGQLKALQNEVNAQSGKSLTAAQAAALTSQIAGVQALLGC